MSKLIFVTVGTSAIDKFREKKWSDIDKYCRALSKPDFYRAQKTYLQKQVHTALTLFFLDTPNFQSLSAELGSLMAMSKEKDIGELVSEDHVVLLYSDTVEGELCAEIAEIFVKSEFNVKTTKHRIENLRATPLTPTENITNLFTDDDGGLYNLQKCIEQEVSNFRRNRENGQIFINITGGYKVLAPFSTILAHNLSMTVVYLYERSNKIIWISSANLRAMIKNPKANLHQGVEAGV